MISAIMMLLSLFIMFYAVKSGNYHRCYYITIVIIFMLLLPLLFFLSGGYHSEMQDYDIVTSYGKGYMFRNS